MTNARTDDPAAVQTILRPFLEGDLRSWPGLPHLSPKALSDALGEPDERAETKLGWYPALRLVYRRDTASGGLAAFARSEQIVLIEALIAPPARVLQELGEPSAVKPHEILSPGSYVHEYVYCARGLVLSVAKPFNEGDSIRIIRCRGLRPLASPDEFGPEFYQPFEDQVAWR